MKYYMLSNKNINYFEPLLKGLDNSFSFKNKNIYIFIEDNNKIIAYIEINEEKIGYVINKILVLENKRYSSYGSFLLDRAFYILGKKNIDTLYVNGTSAKGFFIKNGFKFENNILVKSGICYFNSYFNKSLNVTYFSLLINLFLSLFKIVFGILGKSKALISDGFHSFSDFFTSILVIIGVYIGDLPYDFEHPFGHGKLQSIISNVLGILLLLTGLEIFRSAYYGFYENSYAKPQFYTIYVLIISIFIKYYLYRVKMKVGLSLNNELIIADAKEHKADVLSSIAVLFGIFLAIYINPIFDLLFSLISAIFILKEGLEIIFDSSNRILDKQDAKLILKINDYVLSNFTEVKNIHEVHTRTLGSYLFLSLHIRINKNLTLEETDSISHKIENGVKENFLTIRKVLIHTDPFY